MSTRPGVIDALPSTVAVVGLGLIGGSVALALKAAGYSGAIVGCDVDPEASRLALNRGAVDRLAAIGRIDVGLVVLAVPPKAVDSALSALVAGPLHERTPITDVTSVKEAVVASAEAWLGAERSAFFVPGHPLAGTEHSGMAAARADMFQNQLALLTPLPHTVSAALSAVEALWQAVGCRAVELMAVADHDRIFASTSHLPHLLAYALVSTLAASGDRDSLFRYSGGGLRDQTRVAASDPRLWSDIFLANRHHLAAALHSYQSRLGALAEALEKGDEEALLEQLQPIAEARRALFLKADP